MNAAAAELRRAAELLGLRMGSTGRSSFAAHFTLDGEVDGLVVHVKQLLWQHLQITIEVFLDPPGDFRLHARKRGLFARRAIQLGERDFDRSIVLNGDEPERIGALFAPALRVTLPPWVRTATEFHLTDDVLSYSLTVGGVDRIEANDLARRVRALAELAVLVGQSSQLVPPATALGGNVAAWTAYARQHGLECRPSPLRLRGSLGSAEFTARAVATKKRGYAAELRVRFDEPLPWFLHARSVGGGDVYAPTTEAKPWRSGDSAFDDLLTITTTDATRTHAFFDADVRAALVALGARDGALRLDRAGVSVRLPTMIAPEGFEPIVERIAAVTRNLHQRAGPYR